MAGNPRPENAPWMIPYLTVRDAGASLEFYTKAFGFEKGHAMPGPDGKVLHANVRWHDISIMFGPEWGSCKTPANSGVEMPMGLYFYVDDVDATFKQAVDAGCKPLQTPEDMFWGDRVAKVVDPDGYQWSIAQNFEPFDPSKVPTNFSSS